MRATAEHIPPASTADETSRIVEHVRDLMRAEYLELPTLSLTLPQAMRLWCVDEELCRLGLTALVSEGFLTRSEDGLYRRAKLRRRFGVERRS